MHRQPLLSLLDGYHPADEHQRTTRSRLVEFVTTNPDCFERSLSSGHITGSALITDPMRQQIVLVLHKKLGMWLQPGGHADGEPDVYHVALREAEEETGLDNLWPVQRDIFDLDIHTIPPYREVPEHLHYDIRFLFTVDSDSVPISSSESHEVRWVRIGDILNFTHEKSILRMIRKLSR